MHSPGQASSASCTDWSFIAKSGRWLRTGLTRFDTTGYGATHRVGTPLAKQIGDSGYGVGFRVVLASDEQQVSLNKTHENMKYERQT